MAGAPRHNNRRRCADIKVYVSVDTRGACIAAASSRNAEMMGRERRSVSASAAGAVCPASAELTDRPEESTETRGDRSGRVTAPPTDRSAAVASSHLNSPGDSD